MACAVVGDVVEVDAVQARPAHQLVQPADVPVLPARLPRRDHGDVVHVGRVPGRDVVGAGCSCEPDVPLAGSVAEDLVPQGQQGSRSGLCAVSSRTVS